MAISTPALAPASTAPDTGPARRAAATVLFVLLIAALVARIVFFAWEPPFEGSVQFDDIRPLGDAYWLMNTSLGGPAFAVSWIASAIFIALLARGRSAGVTLAAAVLVGVGGLLFALTITAEVLPFAYAADATVFSDDEGRALFDTFNEQLGMLIPAILGTQAAVALGMLVFLVVALFTRAVPRWLAIAGILYVVAFAALPLDQLGRPVVVVSDLVQTALVAAIGWFGLRAVRRTPRMDEAPDAP